MASTGGEDASFAAGANPAGDAFDEGLYLALNPDIAKRVAQGDVESGFAHWIAEGRAQEQAGLRPTINDPQHYRPPAPDQAIPPTAEAVACFDTRRYLEHNPDVGQTVVDPQMALEHWIQYGRFEGRTNLMASARYARRGRDLVRLQAKPFGVNFYAPFSARSGLGKAARGYLAALRAAGIPVQIYNVNYDMHPARVTTCDYQTPPPYRINLIQANADTIERFYTLFPLEQFDDAYTIAIWAWELNTLRPDWFGAFAAVDEIWTLSEFNTAAVAAMAPMPVRTMSCVVPPPRVDARYDRRYFDLPDGFLFLLTFDVGSSLERKNPYAVLDAFEAVSDSLPDAWLVVKFHSGHNDPPALRTLLRRLRGMRRVLVRSEAISDAAMAGLQACADCLISAHRSEGFGLNIAEFMLLGKPVIATAYSGNMDFTNEENSYLLSYTLRQLTQQSGPYLPGYLWAEPDAAELAAVMRDVASDADGAAERAARGAATVRERLSPAAIGKRITARVEQLGLRQDVPKFAMLLGATRSLAAPEPEAAAALTDPAAVLERPTFSIIVPVYNVDPEWLIRCIQSVRAQTYPYWELCLCDDASTRGETVEVLLRYQGTDPRIRIRRLPKNGGIAVASNAAVQMATGGYLVMLDNDDELTSDALHHMAMAVRADPGIDALYSDEDKIDPEGLACDHYHKPDWSPEHLESVMYTLHPLTVRTSLFLELGGFRADYSGAQDFDLMLRISRVTGQIHHIKRILYHWRMIPGSASAEVDAKPAALEAARRALDSHVAEKYGDGQARAEQGLLPGLFRVRHVIRDDPAVTLLIYTNNGTLHLPGREPFVMVDNFVASILEHTEYRNRRIVVIDNGNSSPAQVARYKAQGVTLHSYDGPQRPFNFAHKGNFGLRQVRTEQLVLLNDDMEAFDPDWLGALLEFSQNPEVGGVAGKLMHADGSIQHAGVVLGVNGGAAHPYHGYPGEFVGYNGYTHVIRNFSALTGACLATRRSVLAEIGGFDTRLAIDYNDVDLCLRLRQHEYRLVYTPFSQLYHFESATEKRTGQNPVEVALFQSRWQGVMDDDPYYNPNLSRVRHDYSLR